VRDPAAVDEKPAENSAEANGKPKKSRDRRTRAFAKSDKISGRKLQLHDSVFERLQLTAIRRKSNPSAIADDILDRHLPKLSIAESEKPTGPE
jgi:hypothetical protein